MNGRLRTAFMGTPELAVPTLRSLHRLTDCQLVVTQPDRPAGRGGRLRAPPVKMAAQELDIPVWQPETLRAAESDPHLQNFDFFIVLAYGEILRQGLLDLPRHGCINLHASLLPRWRGASPLQAALRAGDVETGVSVMRMVRGLDAGPVYLQRRITLDDRATLPWLHDAIAEESARALEDFLAAWPLTSEPQDESQVTHCGKLQSVDGRIDWHLPAQDVARWIRAYTPVPGCWGEVAGQRWRLLQAQAHAGGAALAPGEVRATPEALVVGCAEGAVAIERLQLPGKRPMDAAAFLRGHQPPTRFD